jgi:Zn-dependent protease with chaperone function
MAMNEPRQSFAWRAVVAVSLMIGFYVLAAALVCLLVWIPYAEFVYVHRLHPKIALVCLVGAFLIAKGCFFMADAFQPPGPELTRESHPKLFAVIDDVAQQMGAKLPQHVYMMSDVNAFVAEVGGWMGVVGTHRVMAIGVGMLNTDNVSQLKATIAHEFGHFDGGDTRLGGFLYRTRASLHRVVGGLGDSVLSKPFEAYGKLFMRLTHSISRAQELSADTFSVKVAGKAAHIEGLRREAIGGAMFSEFLQSEVTPLLEEGYKPTNLFEGFRRYLANLGEDGMLKKVEQSLDERATDPYDSHPALRERIGFAESLAEVNVPVDDRLARWLLSKPDEAEAEMTRTMLNRVQWKEGAKVQDVTWDAVGDTVYAARMARMSDAVRKAVAGDGLDAFLAYLERGTHAQLARSIAPNAFESGPPPLDRIHALLHHALGARIAAMLVSDHGYGWSAEPGRAVLVRSPSGELVNTFTLCETAVKEPAAVPALRAELQRLGLLAASAQVA